MAILMTDDIEIMNWEIRRGEKLLKTLTQKRNELVVDRYRELGTYAEVARRTGMTRERVAQIVKRALA